LPALLKPVVAFPPERYKFPALVVKVSVPPCIDRELPGFASITPGPLVPILTNPFPSGKIARLTLFVPEESIAEN
jgi:hypothetical protein